MLDELEEIMEIITFDLLEKDGVGESLMRTLAKCLASQNFQVAERTLLIWQNEHLINDGILKKQHNGFILPFVLPALIERKDYWHVSVTNLSSQLIQTYQTDDIELYDECKSQYEQKKRKDAQERSIRDAEWQKILSGAK